jgi:enoyl-CoA hydratase/carnithine racemase
MSALSPTTFRFEVHDGIGTVTLDRPDRLNALTFDVYAQLRDLFAALGGEDAVRVVVVTGSGRAFCSGGDVKEIIGPLFETDAAGRLAFTRLTCDLVRQMRRLPKPVIASLNGTVAGAGAAIALASDFRIAAEHAKIAFLFAKVGLSGADMGAAFLLPRFVGMGRAMEILALGEFLDAHEAERIGLYNKVVTAETLSEETYKLAGTLGSGPAFAIGMTKIMLDREASMDLESALEAEAQAQALCMEHHDYREAYEAFMTRRPPKFQRGSGTTRRGKEAVRPTTSQEDTQ